MESARTENKKTKLEIDKIILFVLYNLFPHRSSPTYTRSPLDLHRWVCLGGLVSKRHVVSKPGSLTSSSLSTIKSEEGSEAKLKRAATYDEDDFGTESESATTKGFGLTLTNYHAPGPASNLAPKGLGNAPCPAHYSFEWG
ncbi:hypothetical protein BU17DRAFT_79401 [Hysterangium stoloniferum]|nr:hypothetical protein BU17DRAFT_79401 [Hysterangium stoloniferum]